MILTSVVLTFLTLTVASQAQPAATAAGDAVRVNTVLLPDGRLQIWEIGRDRMALLPPTSAGSSQFDSVRAIATAQSWLSRQIPETKEWTAVTTTLRRFGADSRGTLAPNGWFYAVHLEPANQPTVPPAAASTDRYWVVVLLDGTVVEPRIVDVRRPATQISGASPSQGDATIYKAGPGTGVIVPRPIATPAPHYTAEAMRARIQGRVTLACVVSTEGMCEDIRVTESLDTVHGLDAEAIWTAQQWRFAPGTVNGKPVRVAIMIQLAFNLRDNRQ